MSKLTLGFVSEKNERVAPLVDGRVPVEGVDTYVTNKEVDGKTLAELAQLPGARGVFLRKITRGATATSIPILPNTTIHRGDILTIVGRTQDTTAAAKMLGVADRPTDVADVAFIGAGITIGALVGALVWKISAWWPRLFQSRQFPLFFSRHAFYSTARPTHS